MKKGILLLQRIQRLICSPHFIENHRKDLKGFTRRRKLPFDIIVSTLLHLVKKSLGIECELMELDGNKIPPSKQAFSKGRYKISHTAFQELFNVTLEEYYKDPAIGLWKNYRIIAADGSSLRLPSSEEIEKEFGRFYANAKGLMPYVARISLFVDLCTSVILSARLNRWDVGEITFAKDQLPEVVKKLRGLHQEKMLFLYDRGYVSYEYVKLHQDLGVDFLLRLPRNAYLSIWKKVEEGETDFIIDFNGKSSRVVVLMLDTGEIEVLLTSLLDREQWSWAEIGKLYTLRWQIEECYKRLKIPAEIENFSGKNVEAVLQEYWAHLVMCNILATHMSDVQAPWDPETIPKYRLNFSVLFGATRQRLRDVLQGDCSPEEFQKLFDRISKRAKVKIRSGRKFSRDQVGKPKRHHVFRRTC